VHKSYGTKQVLKNISFEIERGDRVAFLGANGIGKSTLLEIVTQSIPAQSGNITWGHAVQFAYFPQDHAKHVHGEHSVLSWLRQFDRILQEEKLRDLLGRVLFTGDDVHKPVNVLSGGETARLLLARMMLLKHNVLIFDEPTNHLDMESAESLWEALQNYPGTLLFVSHNRHFVSEVANRIIELTSDGLLDYRCTFEEYLEKRDLDLLQATNRPKEGIKSRDGALQYEQQKQLQRLKNQQERKLKAAEDLCEKIETQLQKINARLGADNFYQVTPREEIQSIVKQKEELELQLNQAITSWEQLY
jgi:ABC-type multidrug transport system ATPase subunit